MAVAAGTTHYCKLKPYLNYHSRHRPRIRTYSYYSIKAFLVNVVLLSLMNAAGYCCSLRWFCYFIFVFICFVLFCVQEEYQMHVQGKDSTGEYLCPVCRDRAMEHMLGELQVKIESNRIESNIGF